MKALIIYCVLVVVGTVLCGAVGVLLEKEVSDVVGLVVFLALFFTNFVVSWLAVVLIMDGTLKDLQGQQAQLEIEKAGRTLAAQRRA